MALAIIHFKENNEKAEQTEPPGKLTPIKATNAKIIEFDGHTYVYFYGSHFQTIHNPNCKCQTNKEASK